MVITHYSFISSILDENFFSPSMAYTSDGSIIPLKNNKYSQKYKNLVINLIKKIMLMLFILFTLFIKAVLLTILTKAVLKKN